MQELPDHLKGITELRRNLLDIELKELLKKAENRSEEIQRLFGQDRLKDYESYLNNLRFVFQNYCLGRKINFEKSIRVVFESKDNKGLTPFFLAHALMHKEVYETDIFLNHHLKKRTTRNKKIEFINSIKYHIKEIVAGVKVFDNSELLDRMLKWAVSKEEALEKVGKPELPALKFIINKATPHAHNLIEFLSGKLRGKAITEQKKSFLYVFTKHKKIVWRGTVSYLAYLMYRLV